MDTPANYPYAHSFVWGGNNGGRPRTIITSIDVYEGSNQEPVHMAVPLSAYADLGTPRIAKVTTTGSRAFQLKILGGDAASAYTAVLDLKDDRLVHRTVTYGEFPEALSEETTYRLNPPPVN